MNKQQFQQIADMADHNNYGWFIFGSHLYGTNTPTSDYDMVIISDVEENSDITINEFDIHLYPKSKVVFATQCGDIAFIEAMSYYASPVTQEYCELQANFSNVEVNKDNLRKTISAIVSNSYVKSKKKLAEGADYNRYASMKSIFHSIRILDFGIQVAKYGYVKDFKSCAWLYDELSSLYESEDDSVIIAHINDRYKEILRPMRSEFKILCPKG